MLNGGEAAHLSLVRGGGALGPAEGWDDATLARALTASQPGAAREAWDRFAPMVHGFLSRSMGPDRDIEDVLQEVFLRVYARVETLEDPSALRSFIYSIAVRVLRGELRRRWVRRVMSLSLSGTLPEVEASPLDPEARQAMQRLYGVLDRLRAVDRAAFILRHVEGLGLAEVAASVQVSLATVKRRLARAEGVVNASVARDPALAGYLAREPREERP
jgi:RNA polymerase sigma-70 factor (ECF subfamily)